MYEWLHPIVYLDVITCPCPDHEVPNSKANIARFGFKTNLNDFLILQRRRCDHTTAAEHHTARTVCMILGCMTRGLKYQGNGQVVTPDYLWEVIQGINHGVCCWHQLPRVLSRPVARQHSRGLMSTTHNLKGEGSSNRNASRDECVEGGDESVEGSPGWIYLSWGKTPRSCYDTPPCLDTRRSSQYKGVLPV